MASKAVFSVNQGGKGHNGGKLLRCGGRDPLHEAQQSGISVRVEAKKEEETEALQAERMKASCRHHKREKERGLRHSRRILD
jgi:hypothetical protein